MEQTIKPTMPAETFRQKFHISLNPQQMDAVQSVDGRILLLAVPGSGKTTVLVTRLGYMIYCCGIAPENILTVTYTVAATRDMAARFRSIFGDEYADRLEFRTINGICARIIYYYGTLIGKTAFELVTDEKRTSGMLSAIYQKVQRSFATESELKNIRTLITYIKNSMLSEEEIRQLDGETDYHISEIYREYCSQMRRQGLMDYDDQMTYAYRILRSHAKTREYFQEQYRYLCVDEAQDTSKIQFAIMELLADRSGNLFMVGDEDQSIYGFRAACPEELLRFEQKYPDGKVLLMEENFRSGGRIVEAADRFIQQNVLRHEKHMRTSKKEGAPIAKVELKNRREQYDFLMKVAKYGGSSETAVLYRDNESVLPLVDLLERESVPYRMRSADLTFFTNRVVLDIRNILGFALEPDNTELFLQIYYKLNLFLNKQDANRFCELARQKKMPVLEAAIRFGCREEGFDERISRMEKLSALQRNLQTLAAERADRAVFRIENVMGYREYLERMGIGDGKLYTLRTLAAQEATVAGFLERLDRLQNCIREKENDPSCGFILSTIHASKGLEYDTVYLMDIADGVFPENVPGKNVRQMRTAEEKKEWEAYEEERRLFYVGMTRAKRELFVLDWKQNSGFVREVFAAEGRVQEAGILRKHGIPTQKSALSTGKSAAAYAPAQNLTANTPASFRSFCESLGEGLIVHHKQLGEAVIVSMDENYITLQFGDVQKTFLLKFLFEKGMLSVPES